jgi:CrcB protein
MTETNPLAYLEVILIAGIGGFAGSNLRYLFELLLPSALIATFAANVLGCLALGFFFYEGKYGDSISRPARTVIATGFISSFTTYSTFVVDAATATPAVAIVYVAGSYVLGFAAVLAGRGLATHAVARYGLEADG